MENRICETIKILRRRRGISQDILATALEISVQAVSKWETGASLPDILLMPRIAEFFGVTTDILFYGLPEDENLAFGDIDGIKDDHVLRVVQFLGTKYLGHEEWQKDKPIQLNLQGLEHNVNIEVWGNASVSGNVNGYVEAEGMVNCGNVGTYVESSSNVNCGNIGAYLEAKGAVNCGNVSGYLEAGEKVNCGNIEGYVETAGDINCGSINSEGEINCKNLYCKGDLSCYSIEGEVHVEGAVTMK